MRIFGRIQSEGENSGGENEERQREQVDRLHERFTQGRQPGIVERSPLSKEFFESIIERADGTVRPLHVQPQGAGGQGLVAVALGTVPATFSSLVIFLEAIAAAGFGWMLLNEPIGIVQALGGVLIRFGLWIARPRAGETIFVNGGAGNVGSALIQMAKGRGLRVAATAGNTEGLDWCRSLGAEAVANYKTDDVDAVLKKFAPDGVDIYWDTSGQPDFDSALNRLATGGRIIVMVYAENSLQYWRNLLWHYGLKSGDLASQSMAEIMSRTVERTGNDARPLVKVYTKPRLRALFKAFENIQIVQRQISPELVPRRLRVFLPLVERPTGEVLHDGEGQAVMLADVAYLDDIRVR